MIGSEQLYVDNMDWTHSKHVLDKEITSKYWQNIELVCNSEKEWGVRKWEFLLTFNTKFVPTWKSKKPKNKDIVRRPQDLKKSSS